MKEQNMEKSYTLENISALHERFPRTFLKPLDKQLDGLKVGDLVKLIFLPIDSEITPERMWVIITEIHGEQFRGILDNHPYQIPHLKADDEVEFTRDNIAQTLGPNACDIKKFAVITKRALEKQQINRVTWSEPVEENDSGRQLMFGNETDEYFVDSDHGAIITLGQVLLFEPRLEDVFAGPPGVFLWKKEQMNFNRVE